MGPTVYLVIGCEYESQHTVGIYTTLALAEAAVEAHDFHHAYQGALKPGPSGARYLIEGADIMAIQLDDRFQCQGAHPCRWLEAHGDPAASPKKPRRRRPSAGD